MDFFNLSSSSYDYNIFFYLSFIHSSFSILTEFRGAHALLFNPLQVSFWLVAWSGGVGDSCPSHYKGLIYSLF